MGIEIIDRERVDWLTVQQSLATQANQLAAATGQRMPDDSRGRAIWNRQHMIAGVLAMLSNALGAGINAAAIRAAEEAQKGNGLGHVFACGRAGCVSGSVCGKPECNQAADRAHDV